MMSSRIHAAALAATLLLFAAVSAGVSGQAPLSNDVNAFVVNGVVNVGGRPARYSYYFDHNALADAVRVGDALIALTSSGNLLRIDTRTLSLAVQAVVPGRATAIAKDDHDTVLIGTDSGEIATVEPTTLDRASLARVDAPVRWLSRAGNRLVVLSGTGYLPPGPGEDDEALLKRQRSRPQWAVSVGTGEHVARYTLPKDIEPNALLLDGTTLWLGADHGEFGGATLSLDLNTGRVSRKPFGNVLGFVRTVEGHLLAYGGMTHLGFSRGFIARMDGAHETFIRQSELQAVNELAPPPSDPAAPIDDIIEDRFNGGFWVLAAHRLYHTNSEFSSWSKPVDLDALFIAGRDDSVGNRPAISAILAGSRPDELFAVSALDGVRRIVAGDSQHRVFPGQIGSSIVEIWPTSLGTLFLPASGLWGGNVPAWRVSTTGWSTIPLCPPEISGERVSSVIPVDDDATGVTVFCGAGTTSGSAALMRVTSSGPLTPIDAWQNNRPDTPDSFFAGPGRQVFGIAGPGDDALLVREQDRWRPVGNAPGHHPNGRHVPLPTYSARTHMMLWVSGSAASIIWAPGYGELFFLHAEPDRAWRLERVGQSKLANATDVVPDGDRLLVSTPRGLFRFRPADNALERLTTPAGDLILTAARDDAGRLWAAGNQLYVSSDDARSWQPVDLSMLSPTRLKRLRPNPASSGGMFLSLYDRGVLVLE